MDFELPSDFKEFLKLLNEQNAEYLLIGGYAVGYYGYPRATNDMDIWVAIHKDNAEKMVLVLNQFGFQKSELTLNLFLQRDKIIRMGLPPIRIEVLTSISGVEFEQCYANRISDIIDGIEIPIISLSDLRANKLSSGRHKDLDDLENLPNQ